MTKNIIWTIDAKIKNGQQEAFEKVMQDLIEASQQEKGTLNYEWSISENGNAIHIYERYVNVAAAAEHMGNFSAYAERFLAAVEITRFVVYSKLPPELSEGISGLSPVYMEPFGGFSR